MKRGGLGKGLSSLIPSRPDAAAPRAAPPPSSELSTLEASTPVPPGERILRVRVSDIVPNPYQPRRDFDAGKHDELAASVREYGILQPLVVTEKENGMFELISGERRLRAAKAAGLKDVPVIVRTADDQRKLELALIENIQRADLSPVEEAHSYVRLMDEFGLTQEAVAERVGKSRSVVANTLRLLKLPDDMLKALEGGVISMSMARVLCGMDDPGEQRAMFERMSKGEYTVRDAEDAARNVRGKDRRGGRPKARKDANLLALEEELRGSLGTKVVVDGRGGRGKIVIEYYSDEELKALAKKLK